MNALLEKQKSFVGCLLGLAIGDALGLPYEGISSSRLIKWNPNLNQYHLVLDKGMCSDDTEHSCMTAQSLLVTQDVETFQKDLAKRLRWWLLGLPAAIGFATLRAILKLWIGISPKYSGVFSAGNGPAMRSPILGVVFGEDYKLLISYTLASTNITHRDPKASLGSLAIALAAYISSDSKKKIIGHEYLQQLKDLFQLLQEKNFSKELIQNFLELMESVVTSVESGETTRQFCEKIGLKKGISGYIYHTVPSVIHSWLQYSENFSTGLQNIISCGGDTDTTSAILGGLIGSRVGKEGIPENLQKNLWEWPRTFLWIEKLGERLAEKFSCKDSLLKQKVEKELSLSLLGLMLRNICFIVIVLIHGFRRIFP